ncbi:MAG: YncE family protein [Bacteroidota bacterium]|nr:YncE family protein [Bacteroidota bacterium]
MKNQPLFRSIFVAAIFAVALSSCKKDEPVPPGNNSQPIASGDGVFISNEGNFLGGNAKLSFYRFSTGTAIEDMFSPMNTRPLGDVCQSMNVINGNAYVVVNNSGKIEVCAPSNMRSVATITGFVSPRYILPVSNVKAYVSELFSNTVSIVNLTNNTRTGSFPFPGQSEAMVIANNEVFITSLDHDKVYVVNPLTDALTDSITIAKGGNSMQLDNNGKLWVLCYGDYFTSAPGGLYRINPLTHTVEQSWPFTTSESPTHICANSTGDTLYYLNYGVYRFTSNAVVVPSVPHIAQTTQSFYGLGIRPVTGEIFVTDAVDYSQRGHVLRYSASGILADDDLVGVIPGGVWFY